MSRVTEIRYVAYAVTDLAAERSFYVEKWGLHEVAEENGLVYLATEGHDELYVVRLREAEEKRIDVISFAADSQDDVNTLYESVEAAGCKIIHPPQQLTQFGAGYGFRFFSPEGMSFEISSDVERGQAREVRADEGLPERISHIVMHAPEIKETAKFFTDVLGFQISDWLGDFMVFLRCNHWHHRLAFLPGPPCLNHVAYDLPGIDGMMRGIGRLKKLEVDLRWGPGRHTAGNNTFSYFVTPNNNSVEYTAEVEQVDEATWQPSVLPPSPSVMDQWRVGVGGPHAMPEAVADNGLFKAAEL